MIVSEAKRYREHVASNKIVELRINRFETFFAKPAFLSSFSPRTIFSILSLPHLQAFNCRQMFQIPRFLLSLLLSSRKYPRTCPRYRRGDNFYWHVLTFLRTSDGTKQERRAVRAGADYYPTPRLLPATEERGGEGVLVFMPDRISNWPRLAQPFFRSYGTITGTRFELARDLWAEPYEPTTSSQPAVENEYCEIARLLLLSEDRYSTLFVHEEKKRKTRDAIITKRVGNLVVLCDCELFWVAWLGSWRHLWNGFRFFLGKRKGGYFQSLKILEYVVFGRREKCILEEKRDGEDLNLEDDNRASRKLKESNSESIEKIGERIK